MTVFVFTIVFGRIAGLPLTVEAANFDAQFFGRAVIRARCPQGGSLLFAPWKTNVIRTDQEAHCGEGSRLPTKQHALARVDFS
jgi:hypothetical protein